MLLDGFRSVLSMAIFFVRKILFSKTRCHFMLESSDPLPLGNPFHATPADQRSRRGSHSAYGEGNEAKSVRDEIGDFDHEASQAYHAVHKCFGSTIRLKELRGIILTAVLYVKRRNGIELPKFSRNTNRSLPLMIKYIQCHAAELLPVFPMMTLMDEGRRPMPLIDRHLPRVSQSSA
jgi:hypothetical protein